LEASPLYDYQRVIGYMEWIVTLEMGKFSEHDIIFLSEDVNKVDWFPTLEKVMADACGLHTISNAGSLLQC